MGQHQRLAQNQSVKNSAKSARKNLPALALLLASLCFGCASKKTAVPQGLGSAGNVSAQKSLEVSAVLGAKLTSDGESFSPALADNGVEILFLSARPETHEQRQVFLYNLESLSERRVTYQDGQCSSPIFVKKSGDIVYASTTDEIKERPLLFQKAQSAEIPSELYLSDINGSSIRRLTKHIGFDGDAVDKTDRSNSIYFSQQENGAKKILQLNLVSTQFIPVLAKKDISMEDFRPSPSGKKWIWTEKDLKTQQSTTWFAEKSLAKAQTLNLPKGQYQDYFWIDEDHLLLSTKLADADHYQIVSYDLEKKCLHSVISHKSNLTQPQMASNLKSLVFVSDAGGSRQLYYRTVNLDWSAACLGEAAPAPKPTVTTTTTTLPKPKTSTTTSSTLEPTTTVPAAPAKN
jgi:Tol biopolymer transport system component